MKFITIPTYLRTTTAEELEQAENMGIKIPIETEIVTVKLNIDSIVSWWQSDDIVMLHTSDGYYQHVPLPVEKFESMLAEPEVLGKKSEEIDVGMKKFQWKQIYGVDGVEFVDASMDDLNDVYGGFFVDNILKLELGETMRSEFRIIKRVQ